MSIICARRATCEDRPDPQGFHRIISRRQPSRGSRNTPVSVIAQTKHQFQHRYKGLMHDNPWTYCDQSVPSFARRFCGLGQGANVEGHPMTGSQSSAPRSIMRRLRTRTSPISCSRSSVCPIRSSRAAAALGSVVRRKNGAIAPQTSPQLLLFIHTRSNGRSGRLIFRLETTRRVHV